MIPEKSNSIANEINEGLLKDLQRLSVFEKSAEENFRIN